MEYNYYEAVKNDIIEYLNNQAEYCNKSVTEYIEYYGSDEIMDQLFAADEVTGNASGSYTFSTWRAEEYICHNLDLFAEACNEFDADAVETLLRGAEAVDVTIRCYLVSDLFSEILAEMELEA